MSYIKNVNTGTNDLARDAWGRPKAIIDQSLFHGMFSYNVPVKTWYETQNGGAELTPTNATSVDGALSLVAGGTLNDVTALRTFRNLRYEPNRGHLYSTSVITPNPTAIQNRRWGIGTDEHAVFFSLESGTLYGVVRTTTTGGGTTEDKVELDTTGIDLSKGNIYDVQFQWRGVGSYKFFINLEEAGEFAYLGTLTNLSIANPSLPVFFENENLGDNNALICGCVDVSSEGGENNGKEYGSFGITSQQGEAEFTGYNQPIIAVRSKPTFDGLINTRDILALLASFYANEKCICRIWATRDNTAITEGNSSWVDIGDGHLEGIERIAVASTLTFDTAKADLIFTCRVAKEQTYSTSALFEGRTSVWLTPGDTFIFTLHRETGGTTQGGCTFEFAEAI
jgi:hypothetical protein